jgi:ribonuclease D
MWRNELGGWMTDCPLLHPEGQDGTISKDAVNALPISRFEGHVHLVRSEHQLAKALHDLKKEKLLGFDTETKPTYRKGDFNPVSLLQLAGSRDVYLFQLGLLGLPEGLRGLLSNPAVVKCGVAIDQDVRQLAALEPFVPGGFLDLAEWARELGIKTGGLRGLAALLLGFRISKGARTSNWARENLTPAQIRYAATDAWVGREIYLAIERLEKAGVRIESDRETAEEPS